MGNTINTFKPVGYLEVYKRYPSGEEELVWEENNFIVSGMGVGFSHLFSGSGSTNISDYQILNFQVGVSGTSSLGTATYELSGPLSIAEYQSTGSEVIIETLAPIKNGVVSVSEDFVRLFFTNIHRVTETSVRYTLIVDRYSSNNLSDDAEINEVGLFMRNPTGNASPSPILVAFRSFNGIRKNDSFALVFRWTLQF